MNDTISDVRTIRDVMTMHPIALSGDATAQQAASLMRDEGIGDVLVVDDGALAILTDRDLVVRMVADGVDPTRTPVADYCSKRIVGIAPGDSIEQALHVMRENAVRRMPVVADDMVIGIVSMGDLVIDDDPTSALAGVSAAPANR